MLSFFFESFGAGLAETLMTARIKHNLLLGNHTDDALLRLLLLQIDVQYLYNQLLIGQRLVESFHFRAKARSLRRLSVLLLRNIVALSFLVDFFRFINVAHLDLSILIGSPVKLPFFLLLLNLLLPLFKL